MSNPVSIRFQEKNYKEKGVVLSLHWEADRIKESVDIYLKELYSDIDSGLVSSGTPLGRLEQEIVMVDFIRWYLADRWDSSIRLHPDESTAEGELLVINLR